MSIKFDTIADDGFIYDMEIITSMATAGIFLSLICISHHCAICFIEPNWKNINWKNSYKEHKVEKETIDTLYVHIPCKE